MQGADGDVAPRRGLMRNMPSMARQQPANLSDTFKKQPFDTATGPWNEADRGEVVSPVSTAGDSSSFRIPVGISIEAESVVVSDEPQFVEQEVATKVRWQPSLPRS